jgi:hypothetical protein
MCQDYMALEWNVPFEPDDKITQVMARRIHWMDPGMRHISRKCAYWQVESKVLSELDSRSRTLDMGGHREVRRRCLLRRFDPQITSRKTKLAISGGVGWGAKAT